jgi:glycosyltransferase domain-containing protein
MCAHVTIVIPSHCRPVLLARALAHYAPAGLPVIVADSSPEPQAGLPQGVDYLHLPGVGVEAKLELAAARVATPLAVLCADDDFTCLRSIRRCAEFLLAHPDHSAAHGHYLRVVRGRGGAVVEPCYVDTHRARIDADDPATRLVQLNRPYVPIFYAVARTEALRLAFGPGHGREVFYAASELAIGYAAAMLGKVAVLPTLHTVRDIVPSQDLAGARHDNLAVVSAAPEYREVFGLFIRRLTGELVRVSGLDAGAARAALMASVAGFVEGYCRRGPRRPFWRKLPKYGRRLARAVVPGLAAREDAEAEQERKRAVAEYLAPAGEAAHEDLDDILAKLARTPG